VVASFSPPKNHLAILESPFYAQGEELFAFGGLEVVEQGVMG
jgi:hypothetical protein